VVVALLDALAQVAANLVEFTRMEYMNTILAISVTYMGIKIIKIVNLTIAWSMPLKKWHT
jgi:hypothetical protein